MKIQLPLLLILVSIFSSCNFEENNAKSVMEEYFELIKKDDRKKISSLFDEASILYCKKIHDITITKDKDRIKRYLLNSNFPINEVEWISHYNKNPESSKDFDTFLQSMVYVQTQAEKILIDKYKFKDVELEDNRAVVNYRQFISSNKAIVKNYFLTKENSGAWRIDLLKLLKKSERKSKGVLKLLDKSLSEFIDDKLGIE